MNKLKLFAFALAVSTLIFTSCKKDDNNEPSDDHTYVDLGLPSGLLWATCNVGANKPEDYGGYFAWGEKETKDRYNWNTYKWYNGDLENLTKYCTDSSYGTVDNKTVLDLEDDAARANWGEGWRMPTREEVQELKNNCTWTRTTQSGKDGYRVIGPNGNSIFLPAVGCYYNGSVEDADSCGGYWSNSIESSDPSGAYVLAFFDSGGALVVRI